MPTLLLTGFYVFCQGPEGSSISIAPIHERRRKTFVNDERKCTMAKVLRCKDVGMDCDFEARAETEEEILKQVAEHAGTTHDMKEISAEVLAKVRAAIHDE
jgi:predicted small metal-binding protein